ncbi:hypothetical protein CQW23_27881 [Capsicum baccatum]|uniref:Uncharacterized protein n=1 Tax=Capsicum baccatum TaxID=33114 RepID=A0A2G2VEY8_CAPBA|nr:hypothetical protein CQW23_27881 [Capsicum baccatum]
MVKKPSSMGRQKIKIAKIEVKNHLQSFPFGHANVESLIDKFLSRNNTNNNSLQLVEAYLNANVCGFNLQLTQILGEVEIEKKRGESLDQMRKTSQSQCWWEAPLSQLDLQELEQLNDSMEASKKCVTNQASKFTDNEIANSSTFFGDNGNGIFDNYDMKPPRTIPSSSDLHNHRLGFDSAALF